MEPAEQIVAEHAHRVGHLPDYLLAREIGVTVEDIESYRSAHGLPRPLERRGSTLDAHRDIVGVLPDREVAARVGVTRALVHAYRKKHGIPGVGRVQRVEKPKAPKKPRKARRGPPSRLDAHRDQIGVLSDGEVAKLAGLTRAAVKAYRTRNGIPPSVPWAGHRKSTADVVVAAPEPAGGAPTGRRSKIDAVRELVGVLTDGEVAKRVGVSPSAVHMYRRARGIAPAVPQGHHGPASSVAARVPSTRSHEETPQRSSASTPLWGWRITIKSGADEVIRFAVAPDAAAACALANGAGDVLRAERIAEGFA